MMTTSRLTRGQLERSLSQRIQALYREQLGHLPGKITCQLFDAKLAIVIENAITQPELLLVESGQNDLAERVHEDLEKAIQPQLKETIEEILKIEVLDILSDAKLETATTGMIAILAASPSVRN